MAGWIFNSGILFHQAKTGYARTANAPAEDAGNQTDALASIIFAAAALEAWIAEIPVLAKQSGIFFMPSPQIESFLEAFEEVEDSRGSIRLKYLLAKTMLTGQSFDKGANPYQDFDLLFSLRDAIVHMRPERITNGCDSDTSRTDKLVRRLSSRAACEPETAENKSTWLSRVTTRSVARWACNTAAEMVQAMAMGFRGHLTNPRLIDVLTTMFIPIEAGTNQDAH